MLVQLVDASMRPQLFTAENLAAAIAQPSADDASMRPQLFTAENLGLMARAADSSSASMRPQLFTAENDRGPSVCAGVRMLQ